MDTLKSVKSTGNSEVEQSIGGTKVEVVKDPYKWTFSKRLYHTAVCSVFAFTVTIASSIYIPARDAIIQQFRVSLTVALLPYSFYVFGQALGPVLAAPLSEAFGRRGTYAPSMLLFALFTLGAGCSRSVAALTICRFLAGVFGSPVLSVTGGTMADIWMPHERVLPMAIVSAIPFLGPPIGPLISGFVVPSRSWRWTQWILLMFAAFSFLFALGMKETNKVVLIRRQRKKLGTTGSAQDLRISAPQRVKNFLLFTILRPWRMLFNEATVGSFACYIGLDFAIFYSLFAAMPYAFITQYGFGLGAQGLGFLGLAAGVIFAFLLVIWLSKVKQRKVVQAIKVGKAVNMTPEQRLVIALIGSVFIPIGLFWFGWTARSSVQWIVCIIGTAIFAAGNFLIFIAYATYVIDVYGPLVGASATAAVAMVRCLLGGAFPLFTIPMYERLGIGPATSLLAGIVLLLTPVPWMLYRYGPYLRAKSHYIPNI